jgi:hypothetical protein
VASESGSTTEDRDEVGGAAGVATVVAGTDGADRSVGLAGAVETTDESGGRIVVGARRGEYGDGASANDRAASPGLGA